ncbi:MAG: hypothetical protein ACE37H_03165 [Phycisphaeraceae bacterium]
MPVPRNPNVFEPPTAQQLSQHLAANPPVQAIGWRSRLPVLILVVLGLSLLLSLSPALALLPWLVLMGFVVYLSAKMRAARELQERVTRAWEMSMIRRYREALGRAWELVPLCSKQPELHGRVVTIIAHILGELHQDEAAQVAYQYLLDRLPPDHPLALRLKVRSAIAMLGSDRLADADDALRKLRGQIDQAKDDGLKANYRWARLLQDVRTGHYADATEHAEQTAAALQPLGVDAGYGHGLLALCYHQLALHEPDADAARRADLADHATRWWDKATLLIPPAALVFRHPDLGPLLGRVHEPR